MANENLWKQLTNREVEILRLLAEGWSNKQIADKLSITIRTVKFHTNNIYSKMLVASRAEAIAWIWKHLEVGASSDD